MRFFPRSEKHVFSQHNRDDSSFNEFNVILCRNVLSLFQSIASGTGSQAVCELCMFGVLGLGYQESLRLTEKHYEELEGNEKLYRRIG